MDVFRCTLINGGLLFDPINEFLQIQFGRNTDPQTPNMAIEILPVASGITVPTKPPIGIIAGPLATKLPVVAASELYMPPFRT